MATANEFSISIHDLDAGGKQFRFPVRAAWIDVMLAPRGLDDVAAETGPGAKRAAREGDEVKASGDGDFDVRVSMSGNDVVVHGRLKADLVVPCARCLKPAAVHIDQTVTALMVPAADVKPTKGGDDDVELEAGDADVFPYEGDLVVLDDLVRDELVLEIPMIPLCSEDCPGISPPPGMRAPPKPEIDPRLAPLLKFKKPQS